MSRAKYEPGKGSSEVPLRQILRHQHLSRMQYDSLCLIQTIFRANAKQGLTRRVVPPNVQRAPFFMHSVDPPTGSCWLEKTFFGILFTKPIPLNNLISSFAKKELLERSCKIFYTCFYKTFTLFSMLCYKNNQNIWAEVEAQR